MAGSFESAPGTMPPSETLFVLLAVGVPLVLVTIRTWGLPGADFLDRHVTLAHLPARVGGQVRFVLAIPAGAVLVVFVRLTLGLRMLGPVRPVLIAIALQMIGIGPGLLCLGMIVAVVTLVRRVLVGRGLPYFARVAILLTVVAISVLTAVRLGDALDVKALELMSHLPIVVL